MSIVYQTRPSDSPFVESITHGYTTSDGAPTRPAETNWHMVFVKTQGQVHNFVVGPWTEAGVVNYWAGAEILWIRFKLGVFIPHLPAQHLLNRETALPAATGNAFWLKGTTWQLPDFENADTFLQRLAHDELLICDPIVDAALQGHLPDTPSRTVRHRFLRATGLSQKHIQQVERAQQAAALLQQGVSILDTVHELGYFDQPHLTRSLKRFIGKTPAQLIPAHCQKVDS